MIKVAKGVDLVAVPNVIGKSRAVAENTLEGAGFTVRVAEDEDDTATPGTVLSQNPLGRAPQGSEVTITVVTAAAPTKFAVPNVAGKTANDAADELRNSDGAFKVEDGVGAVQHRRGRAGHPHRPAGGVRGGQGRNDHHGRVVGARRGHGAERPRQTQTEADARR